jgi:hypothetical protein
MDWLWSTDAFRLCVIILLSSIFWELVERRQK